MKIFSLNKTGQLHVTHTEDHVIIQELGDEWVIGAVMDGCSSGKESYFASTLYGKIIQKSIKTLPFFTRLNTELIKNKLDGVTIGKVILNQIFDDLGRTHKLLQTDLIEILTTLLLLVYNKKEKSAWINISGDGIIVHDHQIIEIDQSNVPDYMAYHLDVKFENWFDNFSSTYTFRNQSDISISTDGISKFISLFERRQKSIDPIQYLLIDDSHQDQSNMLEKKYGILEKEYGLIPYDDLGMIRIINS